MNDEITPDAGERLSPCTRLCTLDHAGKLCVGCGRTLEEIMRWRELSREARLAIIALLPARLAQLL